MKIFVLVVFILMYLLIIAFSKYKVYITGASAVICVAGMLIFGEINFLEVAKSIKYDVILMLSGIMITVGIFANSEMPNKLSEKLMSKTPNSLVALILVSVLSGFISAFVDNVATVLMLAPIGLAIAKKINVSPIPILIAISVSSNLQGAATLVGDTTSIMLANAAGMSFFDFFFFNGRFSIFWAVEIGAICTIPVLIFVFRKDNKKLLYEGEDIKVNTIVPTIILLVNLGLLVAMSFVNFEINFLGSNILNGLICLTCGVVALIHYTISQKKKFSAILKDSFDYQTVLFLIFLFLIIGCVSKVGIIDDISSWFAKLGNSSLFLLYFVIVFGSVILSAFIDNIPYVATMLPVIMGLSSDLQPNQAILLYFGLLIGATLGGNITPVGASANVVAIGILEKQGYKVKSSDFFKIGLPFTLIAVITGSAFIWLIWGM